MTERRFGLYEVILFVVVALLFGMVVGAEVSVIMRFSPP